MELKEIANAFHLLLFLSFFHCFFDAESFGKSNKPVSVRQGQKVMLPCHLPHTDIEYRFKHQKIYSAGSLLDARYSVYIEQEQSALLFSNASLSDAGIYTCFDKNGGPPSKTYNLTVDDGPQSETVEPDTSTPAGNDSNFLTTDTAIFDKNEVISVWLIVGFVGGLCLGIIIGVAVKPVYSYLICRIRIMCQEQILNRRELHPLKVPACHKMDDFREPAAPDDEQSRVAVAEMNGTVPEQKHLLPDGDHVDGTKTVDAVPEQGRHVYERDQVVMPQHEQCLAVAEVYNVPEGSQERVAEILHQRHIITDEEPDQVCDLKENDEQPDGLCGSENTELLKIKLTKLQADFEAMQKRMNEMSEQLTYNKEKNPEHSGMTLNAGSESFSVAVTDSE